MEAAVTVYCLAYNHERYIRQCLESLVSQKTTFPYKVIVHDDASKDNTKAIIEEFAERYPEIILPIYQEVNQYQQKVPITRTFIEPLVHSKYLAICEGDDYWICEDKLQKQYESMEKHPECGVCVHRTREVTETCKDTGIEWPTNVYPTGILTDDEFFDSFDPRMFHTTSFFIRADYWHEYMKDPHSDAVAGVGDDPLLLYLGSRYPVYQINDVLSCYRRGAASSWSNTKYKVDEQWLLRYFTEMENLYGNCDRETGFKFHRFLIKRTSKYLYGRCALSADFHAFFQENTKDYLNEFSFFKRATIYLGIVFPNFIKRIYLHHLRTKSKNERKRWKK